MYAYCPLCPVPKLIKSAFTVLNLPYFYAGKHEEIIQSKPIHVHTNGSETFLKTFCAMYRFFTSIFRTFFIEDQTDFNLL